jgi:hypothetical protein
VIVQPCDRRVYTNREYQEAGAVVQDDLSEAGLVLGESFFNPCLCDHSFIRSEATQDSNAHTRKKLPLLQSRHQSTGDSSALSLLLLYLSSLKIWQCLIIFWKINADFSTTSASLVTALILSHVLLLLENTLVSFLRSF